MHVRTFTLVQFLRGLYPRAPLNREWGKGYRSKVKVRRGKGKGKRHDGTKGRKGRGIGMGVAPLLLGG